MRDCFSKTCYLRSKNEYKSISQSELASLFPQQVKNKYYKLTYLQTLDFLDMVVLGEDGGVW